MKFSYPYIFAPDKVNLLYFKIRLTDLTKIYAIGLQSFQILI